jgi:hypothetical protein
MEVGLAKLKPNASADPDPGYVYLSASGAMPGFVQIDSCEEDPEGLTWSLQTPSGVTRFRSAHAVRSADCRQLAERFRQAAAFHQIPHQTDFFKVPLRFARNILDIEAKSFLPSTPAPPRKQRVSRRLMASVSAIVATVTIALVLPVVFRSPSPSSATTVATQAPSRQSAAIPHSPPQPSASAMHNMDAMAAQAAAKPRFRVSKM